MWAKYDYQAFDLGNSKVSYKKDGTVYTIDDLIKDKNVTDPETIAKIKEDYERGLENFCWCHSRIS